MALIEHLHDVQRFLGTESVEIAGISLQLREIIKQRRIFSFLFGGHLRNQKTFILKKIILFLCFLFFEYSAPLMMEGQSLHFEF